MQKVKKSVGSEMTVIMCSLSFKKRVTLSAHTFPPIWNRLEVPLQNNKNVEKNKEVKFPIIN